MRTTILTSIFLLSCIIVYGQQLTKEKFIGTWIVVDSQLINDFEYDIELDKDGKEKLEEVKKVLPQQNLSLARMEYLILSCHREYQNL